MRGWVTKRSRTQMLLLSVPLALAAGGAAYGAANNRGIEREVCGNAREFADSVTSERKRLASVDSVVALFDLEDPAVVLKADSEFTHGEPNRLERMVIGLRLEGVKPAQMYRWLTEELQLVPAEHNEHGRGVDPSAQAERLRTHEADSTYMSALIRTMGVAHDPWHDIGELTPLADRWAARCAANRQGIWILPAAFAVAVLSLLLFWFWWLRPTARGAPQA
jgi:hypothetical protein